jgi:hypothetical protein
VSIHNGQEQTEQLKHRSPKKNTTSRSDERDRVHSVTACTVRSLVQVHGNAAALKTGGVMSDDGQYDLNCLSTSAGTK